MGEIPGPHIDVKGQGQSLFSHPLVLPVTPPPPSPPHIHINSKRRMQISTKAYLNEAFVAGTLGGHSPNSSLNFRDIVVRPHTLLCNQLLLLHFPHSHIPIQNIKVIHLENWTWCSLPGRSVSWMGLHESSFNLQTRNNRLCLLFAGPEHQCRVDFGLHAEPDQHDPIWRAIIHTSLPLHLCLPHGPFLPNPGDSGHHRPICLPQAFIFLERYGIAGATEICWLEWEENSLREHFPPQWCTRSSFLAHQGQLTSMKFPWLLLKLFCGRYSPPSASKTSWQTLSLLWVFPNTPFFFCTLCWVGLKDLPPFMIFAL